MFAVEHSYVIETRFLQLEVVVSNCLGLAFI